MTSAKPFQAIAVLAALLAPAVPTLLATPALDESTKFFRTKIEPVLTEQCYECHFAQAKTLKAGLHLDTREGMLTGGETGPALVPGDLASLILKSIRHEDDLAMPAKKPKLAPEIIADFEQWVKDGAPDPRVGETPVTRNPATDPRLARGFWAFQPVKPTLPPPVKNAQWIVSPIDRFILARLEVAKLPPAPAASKSDLIRRVTLDVIGLPPTPEEVQAFLADRSPHAYERLVDRLLWHVAHRRLAAEEIRDAMLLISGRLNPKFGGQSVMVPVDPDLVKFLYKPSQWAVTKDSEERYRRSIYLTAKRNLRLPFMETFDPKPLLNQLNGQTRPKEFGEAKYQFIQSTAKLLGTKRTFKKYGRSGIEISDLFPRVATCVDDLAIIRSCHGNSVVHSAAQYELFSGRVVPGAPSMGAWLTYGLGSASDSLPSYVVMPDPHGALPGGQPMYSQGFLPAIYQPTMFRPSAKPVLNLDLPPGVSLAERRRTLDLLHNLNTAARDAHDAEFSARMNAYDLAFKMQTEAPEVLDLSKEPQETLDLYGIGRGPTNDYGRRCLMARKLVEKGVRFVCVVSGGGSGPLTWDAHDDIEENHLRMAVQTDQPMAALLTDLKRRGLLDTTLVLWGGEFGRSPEAQSGLGRDHHNLGFSMWLAGGGIKGGQVVGATDAIGLQAVEKPYHLRDIHTTILNQMGLDQHQLTYPHLGRNERLTFVEGKVIKEIV